MIVDGGAINYVIKCNDIKHTKDNYLLENIIIIIPMGSVDVVFGVQWLK